MRENKTKRLLREGKVVVGGWVCSSDPAIAEQMADCGFDFVVIDTEHAPQTILGVQAHLMAMKDTPTTSVVRAVWNDFVVVKQLLDLGAEGIVFPWVSNVEHAQQAVASTRYPPRGNRGWGPRGALRRAANQMDYFEHAGENLLVLCQIETREAMEHLDAIARVEGVDALMIGPADLSVALGVPLDWNCETFVHAVRSVRQAADAAGIAFGVITTGVPLAKRWIAEGARMIVAGADVAFLKMMASSTLEGIRQTARDQ